MLRNVFRWTRHRFSFLFDIGKCGTCMRQSFYAASFAVTVLSIFGVFDFGSNSGWLLAVLASLALGILWVAHIFVFGLRFALRKSHVADNASQLNGGRRSVLKAVLKGMGVGLLIAAAPRWAFAQSCEYPDYYCGNQGLCCDSEEKCCERGGVAYCNHWRNGGCSS